MSRLDGRIEELEVLFDVLAENGQVSCQALDTGFTGSLTVNAATAARLGFSKVAGTTRGELADGSEVALEYVLGAVVWLGRRRTIKAVLIETERGSIGMGLLRDVIVHIDTHAGVASIDRAV